jgi:hypothetical protein
MTTFRPRYLYMQSSVGSSSGDPTRHYYVSSLATNGWEWYADTRIATMQTLAGEDNLPDGFVLMLPGGMTGGGTTQTHGLETDADALTGSDACITALTRIRDECISLGMVRGLILYTGPGTLGGDHSQLAPLAALNVPIIMDGGGSAAQALLEEYDTACGQTVGIESAANNDADASAYARMSLTIDGPGALWDSQTYTGGLGGSIRPLDFNTLDNFTGEWMNFATSGSGRTDIVRRARKVFHELKMSVCSAQQNWENGSILRSDFFETIKAKAGSQWYLVRHQPIQYADATPPVSP